MVQGLVLQAFQGRISLHDALSEKEGGEFWKCWKAKFGSNNNFVSRKVNGLADKNDIAAKFAEHFAESCSSNCDLRNAQLKAEYEAETKIRRPSILGRPCIRC